MNYDFISIIVRATPDHYVAAFFTKRVFCIDEETTLMANTPVIAINETTFVVSDPLFYTRDNEQIYKLPQDLLTFYDYMPAIPKRKRTF